MPGRRASTLRGILFVLVGVALANPNLADASRFGLYTDESGSSCSFSGTSPGIMTAYVVVKADLDGVLALRFAAPVPACLDATFLYETAADGVASIGSSPGGISLAFQSCVIYNEPAVALTIHYLANGSTAPCCEFPIVADPFVGEVEITDCSFETAEVSTTTARFNADGSCPCDDGAPQAPSNPSPANLATEVALETVLSWSQSPADLDIVSYDVYFGTHMVPNFIGVATEPTFNPPGLQLQLLTVYYWRVVTHDLDGYEVSSPTWSFTTIHNDPPAVPSLVSPADNSTNQQVVATLEWTSSDPENDPLVYDVYLGTATNPPLVAPGVNAAQYSAPQPLLNNAVYHWKIVARDPFGNATTGPIWNFRTTTNLAPVNPSPVYPGHPSAGVPINVTLKWSVGDPNGDPVTSDLYFGTEIDPPLLAAGLSVTEYPMPLLTGNTTYRWKIVAHDPSGLTTIGPAWSFTTLIPTGADELPIELALGRNHPNPFNPQTTIPYSIPAGEAVRVRLVIHDASGRLVRVLVDEDQSGGAREVRWNGDDESGASVASGVYFCVLSAGEQRRTQKLVLLK